MLTETQRANFDANGYCVLHGGFDCADADKTAATLLRYLHERVGVRPEDRTTLLKRRSVAVLLARSLGVMAAR